MINFDLNGNLYKGAVSGYIEEKRKRDKRNKIIKVAIILIVLFILYVVGVVNTELLLNGYSI